eukprot:126435-Chlamydomonas_euryale.AAC.1
MRRARARPGAGHWAVGPPGTAAAAPSVGSRFSGRWPPSGHLPAPHGSVKPGCMHAPLNAHTNARTRRARMRCARTHACMRRARTHAGAGAGRWAVGPPGAATASACVPERRRNRRCRASRRRRGWHGAAGLDAAAGSGCRAWGKPFPATGGGHGGIPAGAAAVAQ